MVNNESVSNLQYAIIRTYSAGVFAGYIASFEGKQVELLNSRRIWRWAGAATLSELAIHGVSKPDECKFPCVVFRTFLIEVIEIIYCTEKAKASIETVEVWSAQ